jgi:glycosyltransferase involved in cell wall biosynthesis
MAGEQAHGLRPAVTVLMSVYNGIRYLAESTQSILSQSFSDFEFLIVDDGSTDGSAELIEQFAKSDKRIVLLRNETNLGLTRSLNIGLKHARGKYLARQDADDISLPERLELQNKYLEQNPEVGIVGTAYYIINEDGKTIGERTPTLDSQLLKSELIIKNHALNHTSVMARTVLLKKLDGYDESLRYAQDYDLWWRLTGISNLGNIGNKLIKWRASKSQISVRERAGQLDCMFNISMRIVASLHSGNTIPVEHYRKFWMASNGSKLNELLPEDLDRLTPVWKILYGGSGYPPATVKSIEETVYRLYRARNYKTARKLSSILLNFFDLNPRFKSVLSSILKSFIPA